MKNVALYLAFALLAIIALGAIRPARSAAEREVTRKRNTMCDVSFSAPTLHPLNMLQNACLPDAPFTQSTAK
jgi:hypothetical protein